MGVSRKINLQITLLFLFCSILVGQDNGKSYNWTIRPGMAEWSEITTHKEMLEVLKIPKDTLSTMSTIDIVYTCLEYPMFIDAWAYSNLQEGMEFIVKDFNGFQELFRREDAGKILFQYYSEMDPQKYNKNWSELEKGRFTYNFCKIELLMAQNGVLESLSEKERLSLLEEALIKSNNKDKEIFSVMSNETNTYLMGRILQKDYSYIINPISKAQAEFEYFLMNGSMSNKNIRDEIVKISDGIVGYIK